MLKISWIMPALNESENIKRAVEGAASALRKIYADDFEVIVVDDGSADETYSMLSGIAREIKNLRIIRHEANIGYGASLMDGFHAARGELLFYTDSDNQFDPDEITLLITGISEYDIVSGYRKNRKDPVQRIVFSAIYNRMVAAMFGVRSKDINCAFKLYRRNVFERLKITSKDFFVDTEILVKANRAGLKVLEVPVSHRPRAAGASTVKAGNIFSSIRSLMALKVEIGGGGRPQ